MKVVEQAIRFPVTTAVGAILLVLFGGIALFRIPVLGFLLFAIWPFTRLVHVFSAPLGYFTRPYIVYRSRDRVRGDAAGISGPQRGWDRPELQKRK